MMIIVKEGGKRKFDFLSAGYFLTFILLLLKNDLLTAKINYYGNEKYLNFYLCLVKSFYGEKKSFCRRTC